MRASEDPTLRTFLLGDPTACRKVERWAWDIIRFKGFGIPREEQENLLQDTLVGVWQQVSKPGFVLRKNLGPLVRTIAIRRCLDYFKGRRLSAPLPEDIVDPGESPEDRIQKQEWLGLARKTIRKLSPACQDLIRLVFVEELRNVEIAAREGKTPGAIGFRLFTCIRKLRKLMAPAYGER